MTVIPYVSTVYDLGAAEQTDIAWAVETIAEQRKRAERYDKYYRGEQPVYLDAPEYSEDFRDFLRGQLANICPAVVAALTDRLEITGIEGDETAAAQMWQFWEDWNLAGTANRVHTEMVKSGDAYLLVWPDEDGVPRLYPHTALNVCHEHDDEKPEVITKAAKLWKVGKRYHLTLYYADRIERYRTAQDDNGWPSTRAIFEPFEDAETDAVIPNPYDRVPVFHFPYQSDMHGHGTSLLRDIIPRQNSINENLINRAVVLRFQAFPLRIIMGVDADADAEGRPTAPLRIGIDRLLTLANPQGGIAEFKAASIEPYTTAIREDLNLVTVMTGIPPHHFQTLSGDFPSGESLKVSESRLVSRIKDAQVDLSSDWNRVLQFMLAILGTAKADVRVMWREPITRSENEEVERAAVKVERIGISQEMAWEELGYTQEQISVMQTQKELQTMASADAFNRSLNAQ
jgi:hypothetical protein